MEPVSVLKLCSMCEKSKYFKCMKHTIILAGLLSGTIQEAVTPSIKTAIKQHCNICTQHAYWIGYNSSF